MPTRKSSNACNLKLLYEHSCLSAFIIGTDVALSSFFPWTCFAAFRLASLSRALRPQILKSRTFYSRSEFGFGTSACGQAETRNFFFHPRVSQVSCTPLCPFVN